VTTAIPQILKAPGFPVAVARVGGTKAWLLEDVGAYGPKSRAAVATTSSAARAVTIA